MKKNLIVALALVFVLGIAGTAFAAANPFVDVPAKHWAYDAVSKLAQAGILDGYGDGTYRGERLATRYEMAQATAKAMARSDKANAQLKALIDKLAVEFAAELNNLGVRVAKLEKWASTIKFTGDSRTYIKSNLALNTDAAGQTAQTLWNQRIRLYATAEVNQKAMFYGRIQAAWGSSPHNAQSATGVDGVMGASSQADLAWDYGYFEWTQTPSFKFAIGRQMLSLGQGFIADTNGQFDAIQFKFGATADPFKLRIMYGDTAGYDGAKFYSDYATNKAYYNNIAYESKYMFAVDATYQFSKDWAGNATMAWNTDAESAVLAYTGTNPNGKYLKGAPFQIYGLGVTGQLSPDFKLRANYAWNTAQKVVDAFGTNPTAWAAELWYRGAVGSKVGSWGLSVNYKDIKPFSLNGYNASGILSNSLNNSTSFLAYGVKGFGVQANYTISKNAIITATYEALARNRGAWTNGVLATTEDTTKLLPYWYVQMNVTF